MGRRSQNHKLDTEDDNQQNGGLVSKNKKPRRNKRNKPNKVKGASKVVNPFFIFFLRMRSKRPNDRCTVIAQTAGKKWKRMTPGQRQKYINLANAAKKKQQIRKRKKGKKNMVQ